MKKAISLILAFVLCLSLCACGKSRSVKDAEALIDAIGEVTAESSDAIAAAEAAYAALTEDEKKMVMNRDTLVVAKEELLFLEAEALFDAGQYDEALGSLRLIDSYKKVADLISFIERSIQEQERLAQEAEYAARPREQIQIGPENLETYFEFLFIPYFDPFGQLDSIACKLFPRDEYIDRIDFGSDFVIDIGYTAEGVTATVEYDKDLNTFTYKEALPGWGGTCFMDEILSVSNKDLALLASYKSEDAGNVKIQSLGNIWFDDIYHQDGMNGCNEWSHHIEQVQGTLVLFAEQ